MLALTGTPSTSAGFARSAAGSPEALRLHRPNAARHASGGWSAQASPGARAWAYTPISSSLVSPAKPPAVPFGVQLPDRGSSPVPRETVYSACARTMVSTVDRVVASRSDQSSRAARTK